MTEVEKLLTDKEVQFYSKGKDLLVRCFNPEHDDDNPSMRIDREEGVFHCFGCGYKGNVFTTFNRYRNIFNSKVKKLKDNISEVRRASWGGLDFPSDAFFIDRPFRGIPAHIIKEFQGFTTSKYSMEDRIVFPIKDNMECIQAFQGRYAYTDASPKYLAYPAETSIPWFPSAVRITPMKNSIILVEGFLDALYLRGKGLTNVVSIFGTKNFNQDNIVDHLTPYILRGIDTVYLMMDGDKAGDYAAELLLKLISQKTDLIVERLILEEGEDPATVEDKYIEKLLAKLQ